MALVTATAKQRALLLCLKFGPKTTKIISTVVYGQTLDSVQKSMRRMEDNGWVRRYGYPFKWELTEKGREILG